METNNPRKKQKAMAAVVAALSIIVVVSVLVYKNQDEVIDFGESLLKKGKAAGKKGLKQSSLFKEKFNDLIDQVQSSIKKAVA